MTGKKRHFGGAFFFKPMGVEFFVQFLYDAFRTKSECLSWWISIHFPDKDKFEGIKQIRIFKFIQQILDQTTKGVDHEQKASV